MTKEEQFISALLDNLRDDSPPTILRGVVDSSNESTCSVELTGSSLLISDVLVSAVEDAQIGIRLVPKKGSNVLVGMIGGDENSFVVLKADEYEKVLIDIENTSLVIDKNGIVINGGDNAGLVISEKVCEEINVLKSELNSLKQAFSAWVPASQDGGAGLKAGITAWASQLLIDTLKASLENDKVKH